MKIQVDLAENNNQGNPCGRLTAIEFSLNNETFLHIKCWPDFIPIKTSLSEIKIHGLTFPHSGRAIWVGNMMWNQYDLSVPHALGLIQILMNNKRDWSLEEAWSDIYHAWDNSRTITGAMLGLDEDFQPEIIDPNQIEIKF